MQFQKIQVQFEIFKENGHFIAYCKPFDLVTQGKTFEEAKTRFEKLVPAFIDDLRKRGTLDEVLTELGWTKVVKAWSAPVKVGEAVSEVKVPCPA
jgi:predicted RNase H-like HicB family nuclease